MSSLPPEPPPSPGQPAGLPWEERSRRGFFPALLDTMGLFVSRPSEAWSRTRLTGDIGSPLLFGIIVGWFSLAVHRILHAVIGFPVVPGVWARRFEWMERYGHGGLVAHLILLPFVLAVGLFVGALILHFCCLIVGALTGSPSGFEGTFRVVSYSHVSSLAAIVPFVGGFAALVWWVILAVMGTQRLHRTTQGKAVAAVLIPIIVCCGGIVIAALLVGAAIFTRMHH